MGTVDLPTSHALRVRDIRHGRPGGQDLEEVEVESEETGQDGSKGRASRQPGIQLVTEHTLSTCDGSGLLAAGNVAGNKGPGLSVFSGGGGGQRVRKDRQTGDDCVASARGGSLGAHGKPSWAPGTGLGGEVG